MLSSQQQQSPYEYDDDDDEILRGKYIIIRLVVQDRKVRATLALTRSRRVKQSHKSGFYVVANVVTDRFSLETFATGCLR